jgi:hypothetical protein
VKPLFGELSRAEPEIAQLHPIERYAAALGQRPRRRGYTYVDEGLRGVSADIARRFGAAAVRRYHRLVLAYLASTVEDRLTAARVPPSVGALITIEIDRITRALETADESFYDLDDDLFLKDLGLCLLDLLPCGAELVQVGAGVPRSVVLRGGAGQVARSAYFFARAGGRSPFYALHMDPRQVTDFSPEGWNRTYLRIADLLALHPEVKGVFGTAWFYDPAITRVSPHLAYLRQQREEHGAWNFRFGPSEEALSGALEKSGSRRRLHAEGLYVPASYYLIWPRRPMIAWAERMRGSIPMQAGYERERYR